jgi:effector-binding domain-containing protein
MSSPVTARLPGMTPPTVDEPELVDIPSATTAVISGTVAMDELADFFDRSFSRIPPALTDQGVAIAGPAFALYHGPPTTTADLEVGFATDRPVRPDGDVRAGSLPGGQVARLVHRGSFDRLTESWGQLRAWIEARGLTPAHDLWEVYVTEPSPDMDPADLRTELYWPLEA